LGSNLTLVTLLRSWLKRVTKNLSLLGSSEQRSIYS